MVRRKEDAPLREVKVAKKPVVRQEFEPAKPVRSLRLKKSGGGIRMVLALVLILALIAIGWFATTQLLNAKDGGGGLFASWFKQPQAQLVGEEEGRVNFVLMGQPGDPTHDGPYLTDTLIVVSYDTVNKKATMFSVPRDTWANVPGYGWSKINAAYELGTAQGKDGAEVVTKTLEDLLGLTIPYYARIDFAGFETIVNQLGGITVEVKKDLYDPNYPDNNKGFQLLDIKAGTRIMDGAMALKYARSRQSTSDFDRARRQQEILVALRNKASELDLLTTPTTLLANKEEIKDHFATNLSSSELLRVITLMTDFDSNNVVNKVLDDSAQGVMYGTKVDGAFVLKPLGDDYNKIKEFVKTALETSTSTTDPEEENAEPLKIEVLNGTNVVGLAGKIADTLKISGFNIIRTGNNPTKGITKSVIYDGTGGKRSAALSKLAEKAGATLSSETITLPAGVEARLVVGQDAAAQ